MPPGLRNSFLAAVLLHAAHALHGPDFAALLRKTKHSVVNRLALTRLAPTPEGSPTAVARHTHRLKLASHNATLHLRAVDHEIVAPGYEHVVLAADGTTVVSRDATRPVGCLWRGDVYDSTAARPVGTAVVSACSHGDAGILEGSVHYHDASRADLYFAPHPTPAEKLQTAADDASFVSPSVVFRHGDLRRAEGTKRGCGHGHPTTHLWRDGVAAESAAREVERDSVLSHFDRFDRMHSHFDGDAEHDEEEEEDADASFAAGHESHRRRRLFAAVQNVEMVVVNDFARCNEETGVYKKTAHANTFAIVSHAAFLYTAGRDAGTLGKDIRIVLVGQVSFEHVTRMLRTSSRAPEVRPGGCFALHAIEQNQ